MRTTTHRRSVRWLWAAVDVIIVFTSVLTAAFMRYDFDVDLALDRPVLTLTVLAIVGQIALGSVIGPYAVGHDRGSYEEIVDVGQDGYLVDRPVRSCRTVCRQPVRTAQPGIYWRRPCDAGDVRSTVCAANG